MNAVIPIRTAEPDKWADCERLYAPRGHDAPKHSVEWANYEANRIASHEVYGKAIHSKAHRLSLEAWQRGERDTPWPDPTPAEQAAADAAVRELAAKLDKGLRVYRRGGGA
jgi:hypothetical protein